jgi:hypothetical protein
MEGGMQQASPLQIERAKAFFDRFVDAFATFDSERIAALFAAPGVALRSDGSLVALTTREDIVQYYRSATEGYHQKGCRSCRWTDLDVTATGDSSMLATVTWDLLREDDSIIVTWRQSYHLAEIGDGPRAFASAMHAAPQPSGSNARPA